MPDTVKYEEWAGKFLDGGTKKGLTKAAVGEQNEKSSNKIEKGLDNDKNKEYNVNYNVTINNTIKDG